MYTHVFFFLYFIFLPSRRELDLEGWAFLGGPLAKNGGWYTGAADITLYRFSSYHYLSIDEAWNFCAIEFSVSGGERGVIT